MKKSVLFFALIVLFQSCKSTKKATVRTKKTVTVERNVKSESPKINVDYKIKLPKKAKKITSKALSYIGTKYKYGGTTKRGMDCSGLIYVSFTAFDVSVERVSYKIAAQGKEVRVKNVVVGDLLFFKTSKRAKRINHVGLVVDVDKKGTIKFIHASTSRGVMVSSLREGFWNHAFVKATRIL